MTAPSEIDTALLEQARPLVADGITKTKLREALRCRYDTASEVWERLSAEQARPVPAVPADIESPAAQEVPAQVKPRPPVVPPPARRGVPAWPILLLALPAFVAIWSGWVDLGRLTGFGVVHPFPGIPTLERFQLNTAITLPIGLETYAAYALRIWVSPAVPDSARTWARGSAIGALCLGAAGQIAYHLMVAGGVVRAPWWITVFIACIPVAVLGLGAYLWHTVHNSREEQQ